MSKDCIRLTDVYKRFGNNKVLRGLNFSLKEGQIMALLGHNGSGKTTTLRILLGLLEIDSGEVIVLGRKVNPLDENIRKETGVLSEDNGLYESLTVYDNLKFFADIYGCDTQFFEERIDYLLDKFNILDCKYKVIKNFSLGMKKKVAIIRTLFHNPKLVLMDEPVNALDPISIQTLHEIMRHMKEQYGTTFIITTHNLDEVVKICDVLVIVKQGKSVFERSIELGENNSILETHITIYNYVEHQSSKIIEIMNNEFCGKNWKLENNKLIINYSDAGYIAAIVKKLSDNNIAICDVTRNNFSLEKLYVDINTEE